MNTYYKMLLKIYYWLQVTMGFPHSSVGKESACHCRRCRRHGFNPLIRKSPWRRKWQPTPVFLLGKSHGWGAQLATVLGITKSGTQLSDWARINTGMLMNSEHHWDPARDFQRAFRLMHAQLLPKHPGRKQESKQISHPISIKFWLCAHLIAKDDERGKRGER